MRSEASPHPRWGDRQRDHKAQVIWSTLVLMEGKEVGGGAWLDIGCGSGRIALGLAEHVSNVCGVDPEPWPDWVRMADATSNLQFRVARCDDMLPPAAAESIDVVVCNQVYEHVDDPRQLIRNIGTILSPAGCCYFAGPNLLWPVEPHVLWPFVHWLPRRTARCAMRLLGSKRAEELDAHSTHYWKLARWFREAGLDYRPAIFMRLRAEMELRGWRVKLPRWLSALVDYAVPFSPGFIFILRRR